MFSDAVLFPLKELEGRQCENCKSPIAETCHLTVCGHVLCPSCFGEGYSCCDNEEYEQMGPVRIVLSGRAGMEEDFRLLRFAVDYSCEKEKKIRYALADRKKYVDSGGRELDKLREEIDGRARFVEDLVRLRTGPDSGLTATACRWIEGYRCDLRSRADKLHGYFDHAVSTAYFASKHLISSHGRLVDFARTAISSQENALAADQAMQAFDLLFGRIEEELDDGWSHLRRMRLNFMYWYSFPRADRTTLWENGIDQYQIWSLMGAIGMVGEPDEATCDRIDLAGDFHLPAQ